MTFVDFESVADELYRLPLDEFTPTRGEREKQARSAGDKEMAAQIRQLAKPNLVAWLANQLARECADEIRPLLELGEGLREATATLSGEALRELSRQQRQLIAALVKQARRLANAAGRKVSEDTARSLEDTLRAALVDPDAAEALTAGRLTQGMQNIGFGSPTGWVAPSRGPSAKEPTAAHAPSPAARQSTLEAKSAADEADAARADSLVLLAAADQAVADTGARVERVRRELEEALQGQSSAEKDQAQAQVAFDRAARVVRAAEQRLAEANLGHGRTGDASISGRRSGP